MPKLPDTAQHRTAIAKLVAQAHYVGSVSTRGFIIKRNFGVRRLPIYGVYKNNQIFISIKNEFLHQVFLIFGSLVMALLTAISFYMAQYVVGLLLLLLLLFIWLDNYNRKKKEYQIFIDSLAIEN